MNRDDIIRLAREAGMERVLDIHKDGTRTIEIPHPDLLERFYQLAVAAEREACRDIAAQYASCEGIAQKIERDIRERGEKWGR